jgi:mono/diheme cytochrome c family protein
MKVGLWIAAAGALIVSASRVADAHKPVTSPYDYNNAVFPLLREHCGSCHAEGGAAPMSLMTYKDAVSWAESIRDELQAGRMPPWPVDSRSRSVQGGRTISSHDLDAIVTWASGGTPHSWAGDPNVALPKVAVKSGWHLGPPDLVLTMDQPHTMGANDLDETCDFSLPLSITETKWIRAADLLPGKTSMVRDAIISIEKGETLAVWQPASDAPTVPAGTAFELKPGSQIHLQIHYKKHYDQEQASLADKSSVGLYFATGPAAPKRIETIDVAPAAGAANAASPQKFSASLPGAGRIVAVTPLLNSAYGALDVMAVSSDGTRTPLLLLRGPRPQWFYRYWLKDAAPVPPGATIEVTTTPLADYADDLKTPQRFQLKVGVEYVPE